MEKITGSLNEELPTGDRKIWLFQEHFVQAGSALGVVVETGDSTEVGKINHALQSVDRKTTPARTENAPIKQANFPRGLWRS